MSFADETPLEDVLKYIKSATQGANDWGIPIYVDPVAMKELKVDPKSATVMLDLEGVPLRTSLRVALKQLNLAYCVSEGMLIISSVQGVLEELKEAEAAQRVANLSPPPPPVARPKAAPPRAEPRKLPDPGL